MAIFIIGNDYTGYSALGAGNSYILTEGSVLAHTGNAFDFANTLDHVLTVNGSIVSQADGIASAAGSAGISVTVNPTGSVVGESDGIQLDGSLSTVVNHGAITGLGDTGVEFRDDNGHLSNFGTIHGRYGAYVFGNYVDIVNSGVIQAERTAVSIYGDTGTSSMLHNSGVIATSNVAYHAVVGGNANDFVVNSGTIVGSVALGGGHDLFDNRGGLVTGELFGGVGNDTYIVDSASTEIIEYFGDGTDLVQSTVSYNLGANLENLELLANDALTGWGNYLDNVINGNEVANVLRGMGGDDTIYGEGGDDLLYGGRGHDTMEGNNGDDRLYGGIDNDLLYGNDGNDNLLGEAGTDRLFGGDGNDSLLGGANNDNLNGDAGADTLEGGSGFDRLVGGAGDDELTGDFNADTFIFSGNFDNDTITDFDANNDFEKIQLSGVSSIVDFADLVANHMTQVGADVLIDAGGGNTITLLNVNIGDLDAVDFIF